jgi:hypothetical protein
MDVGRRRVGLLVVVALALATGAPALSAAGAGAAAALVPWQALAREHRAQLIASGHASVGTPSLATAPTPQTVAHDPTGDVARPQSDITSVGFGRNANGFIFSTNVVLPVNPKTDPGFQEAFSFVGWALDTNGDDFPDRIVFLSGDGGGHVFADMAGIDGSDCPGTAIYKPGAGYQAVFSPSCGAGIHKFRLQAAVSYTTDPNEEEPPFDIAPNSGWTSSLTLSEEHSGYWLLGADGKAHAFGLARQFQGGVFGAVSIAAKRNGRGYWIVDFAGGAHPFGSATNRGGYPLLQPGEWITASAATPSGNGYWMFSNVGRAFVFGDAHSYGDMSGTPLRGAIVAAVANESGHGYYMLGSDGGVFTFGDAGFHGSLGAKKLNGPVVDIAISPNGYWLFASDGGVFAFHTPFRGSMGGHPLNAPVTTGVAVGKGYLLVAADGGVFNFSDRPFLGSLGGTPQASRIIDAAAFSK